VSRFGKGFNKPVAGKGAAACKDYFHFLFLMDLML
jgi:hypothetical protein